MLDNPTYVNGNTPIGGLQVTIQRQQGNETGKTLSNGKITTISNKNIVICACPLLYI